MLAAAATKQDTYAKFGHNELNRVYRERIELKCERPIHQMTNMVPSRNHTSASQVYLLIALLCGIAGAVDALAYLQLGKLFVANLTGNTVLFAYHAAERQWILAAERLALIVGFFSGVVTDRLLRRWIESDRLLLRPSMASLAIECSVLCVLAFLSVRGYLRMALLITLAWTMGLQNDAFQRIGPVNLNTTFLTGDIEKLGSILASPPANGSKERQRREKIIAFATTWIAYGSGAVLGAVAGHSFGTRALLVPAALTAIVFAVQLKVTE